MFFVCMPVYAPDSPSDECTCMHECDCCRILRWCDRVCVCVYV